MLQMVKISFILPVLVGLAFGQNEVETKKKEWKVNPLKPGVYMIFKRYEQYRSRESAGGHKLAWFQIHNNMKESVRFCSYDASISPNKGMGPRFELEKIPDFTDPTTRDNSAVPFGIIESDICKPYTLKTGEHMDFALVVDEYLRNTRIKVRIYYSWEDIFQSQTGKEPQHFVYFYLRDLPQP